MEINMENFVKDYKDPNSILKTSRKWRLSDELEQAGYFISRDYPHGYIMHRHSRTRVIHWNTTLKNMDEWITWKKDTLFDHEDINNWEIK
jgi:hypothetical protein